MLRSPGGNGTISPGLGGTPSNLTTGNLTFGGSTFRPVLTTSSGRDKITATGAVDLTGATLTPNVTSSVPVGTPITVIAVPGTVTPATGMFANAPTEGATVTGTNGQMFTVSYHGGDGNDVTLTATTPGPSFTLSVNSVSRAEGNVANNLMFTVTLSAPSTDTITVQYATVSGSAIVGSDFSPASGTVTFMPGETSKPINVTILGDTDPEPTESFTVTLSNANGATIGTGTGTATLINDDGTPPPPPADPGPGDPGPGDPAPAPAPFFSGAIMFGNTLFVTGAGVPGGVFALPLPLGSFGFFTDVSGDGQGDVVLFLPNGIFVLNGQTGALFFAFFDSNGDGIRELII